MRRALQMIGLVMAAGVLSSCAPWSTYPPVETTGRFTKPTFEPMPTVMATAIRFAQEKYVKDQNLPINLPEGTPAQAYQKVFEKLGKGEGHTDPAKKALHITQVRTRGFDAQVDLIYPRADGLHQQVTLTLRGNALFKYRVVSERPWRLRDVTPPAPSYVPIPEKNPPE